MKNWQSIFNGFVDTPNGKAAAVLAEIEAEYKYGELFGDNGILSDSGTELRDIDMMVYTASDGEEYAITTGLIFDFHQFDDFGEAYIDTENGTLTCDFGEKYTFRVPWEICDAITEWENYFTNEFEEYLTTVTRR